jgi:hypothetical protein
VQNKKPNTYQHLKKIFLTNTGLPDEQGNENATNALRTTVESTLFIE